MKASCRTPHSAMRHLFGVVMMLALSIAPAPKAHAFLELLICEMDGLNDYCLARTLLEQSDEMEDGLPRDIAVVYAYGAWTLSTHIQAERDLRHPRPSYFADRIDNRQAEMIIWTLDQILRVEDTDEAIEIFARVEHPIPRMIAFPMIIEALDQMGQDDLARSFLDDYATEIEALRRPPARQRSYSDLAWIAARIGAIDVAQMAVDRALEITRGHPSEDFQTVLAVDIAAAEYLLTDGAEGLDRLPPAQTILEEDTDMPDAPRLEALARIARVYGRLGMEEPGRALAQSILYEAASLPDEDRVKIYAILVFAMFQF